MDGDESPRAVFELRDAVPAGPGSDVLGLWTAVPLSPTEAVTLNTDVDATARAPVWRANLPADPDLLAKHLSGAGSKLDASQYALTTAPDRLNALKAAIAGHSAGLAFDLSSAKTELAQPEEALLALLAGARADMPTTSFGVGEELARGWEQVTQEFQGFLARLRQIVEHYAWVETHVEGRLLGQTRVGWMGDARTFWQEGLDAAQMSLHQRTLSLALMSRRTLLQTSAVIVSGAARLSVLFSTGGFMALPAMLMFINQVRAELQKRQAMREETLNGN